MKRIFLIFFVCAVFQTAFAQENAEPAEQSAEQGPSPIGFTLGLGVTAGDVMDKAALGVRSGVVFNKLLGGLHLYGNVYDKVLNDDSADIMRTSHFEEEIGYRLGISQAMGTGVFVNNVNNISAMAMTTGETQTNYTYFEGLAESGLIWDGTFSFGRLQADAGIPVLYQQSRGTPDAEPIAGLHPEIRWQSNFGLGLYGGLSFAFPPGSNKELSTNEMPFERTEWKISYMTGSFYVELYLYTTLDFKKVNICPTITYFTGPFSVWASFDIGKINYQTDFGVQPVAGITYSF
jgi:hypothetical protein